MYADFHVCDFLKSAFTLLYAFYDCQMAGREDLCACTCVQVCVFVQFGVFVSVIDRQWEMTP